MKALTLLAGILLGVIGTFAVSMLVDGWEGR
jgi:hypothetical protein